MNMAQPYDNSWDSDDDSAVFERKCEEWENREWDSWLKANLIFPFEVKREEDMEENPYNPNNGPFSVGCRMRATALGEEDFPAGFLVCVESGKKTGSVPLGDVDVTSKKDQNYWPVREYAVWMANH